MSNNFERIILDTNLWISFLITKRFEKLDRLLIRQKTKLLFSKELLEEFLEVAKRPKFKKYFPAKDLQNILEVIEETAEFINVKSKVTVCRDFKDNFLLALAIDGEADYLLTGDIDLLILGSINSTIIMTIDNYLLLKNKQHHR